MRNLARRLSGLGEGFFDAFVRDNKVLPPVLALLALFLFAWVVAGALVNEPDDGDVSGQANLIQSRDPSGDAGIAPEVEDRDADSYAAYRNKDPFRQLLAPAENTSETPDDEADDATDEGTTAEETTTGETTTGETAAPETTTGGGGGGGSGGGSGGKRSRADSDGDGLTNRREERLGQDPRDPDTDDDGILDGSDDSDGDGVPDGRSGDGGGGSGGSGGAGAGDNGGGGNGGGGAGGGSRPGSGGDSDDLFDSGGTLSPG